MKFIRVRGRVVPVRDNGAIVGSKKKYPSIKQPGNAVIAGASALGAFSAMKLFKPTGFNAGLGALAGGLAAASLRFTSKAKGESNKHVALRIARSQDSRKKR